MICELFSVFDQAARRFLDPFTAPTVDFALRGFKEACHTEGHQFQKHPTDYVLYHVATFNMEDASWEVFDARKIGMASSFVHGGQIDLEDSLTELGA